VPGGNTPYCVLVANISKAAIALWWLSRIKLPVKYPLRDSTRFRLASAS